MSLKINWINVSRQFLFQFIFILTFLLNVLIIIKISGDDVIVDHTSCVLIIIPSPMKEPKETPDEIMITGITMNDLI